MNLCWTDETVANIKIHLNYTLSFDSCHLVFFYLRNNMVKFWGFQSTFGATGEGGGGGLDLETSKTLRHINPQAPDGVYKPPLVYCRMGFINTSPFSALHLSRNAAKVSESLKISDQRMAKLYWAVFIHKQPLEDFPNLVMPPLASLSPLCRANFQGVASSHKMETKGK